MPDEKKGEIADGKLKRKDYERELERLHVEFVKLQQIGGAQWPEGLHHLRRT